MTGFIALSLQDAAVDRLPLAVDKRFLFPTYAASPNPRPAG